MKRIYKIRFNKIDRFLRPWLYKELIEWIRKDKHRWVYSKYISNFIIGADVYEYDAYIFDLRFDDHVRRHYRRYTITKL